MIKMYKWILLIHLCFDAFYISQAAPLEDDGGGRNPRFLNTFFDLIDTFIPSFHKGLETQERAEFLTWIPRDQGQSQSRAVQLQPGQLQIQEQQVVPKQKQEQRVLTKQKQEQQVLPKQKQEQRVLTKQKQEQQVVPQQKQDPQQEVPKQKQEQQVVPQQKQDPQQGVPKQKQEQQVVPQQKQDPQQEVPKKKQDQQQVLPKVMQHLQHQQQEEQSSFSQRSLPVEESQHNNNRIGADPENEAEKGFGAKNHRKMIKKTTKEPVSSGSISASDISSTTSTLPPPSTTTTLPPPTSTKGAQTERRLPLRMRIAAKDESALNEATKAVPAIQADVVKERQEFDENEIYSDDKHDWIDQKAVETVVDNSVVKHPIKDAFRQLNFWRDQMKNNKLKGYQAQEPASVKAQEPASVKAQEPASVQAQEPASVQAQEPASEEQEQEFLQPILGRRNGAAWPAKKEGAAWPAKKLVPGEFPDPPNIYTLSNTRYSKPSEGSRYKEKSQIRRRIHKRKPSDDAKVGEELGATTPRRNPSESNTYGSASQDTYGIPQGEVLSSAGEDLNIEADPEARITFEEEFESFKDEFNIESRKATSNGRPTQILPEITNNVALDEVATSPVNFLVEPVPPPVNHLSTSMAEEQFFPMKVVPFFIPGMKSEIFPLVPVESTKSEADNLINEDPIIDDIFHPVEEEEEEEHSFVNMKALQEILKLKPKVEEPFTPPANVQQVPAVGGQGQAPFTEVPPNPTDSEEQETEETQTEEDNEEGEDEDEYEDEVEATTLAKAIEEQPIGQTEEEEEFAFSMIPFIDSSTEPILSATDSGILPEVESGTTDDESLPGFKTEENFDYEADSFSPPSIPDIFKTIAGENFDPQPDIFNAAVSGFDVTLETGSAAITPIAAVPAQKVIDIPEDIMMTHAEMQLLNKMLVSDTMTEAEIEQVREILSEKIGAMSKILEDTARKPDSNPEESKSVVLTPTTQRPVGSSSDLNAAQIQTSGGNFAGFPIVLQLPEGECPKYCINIQVEVTRQGRSLSSSCLDTPRCNSVRKRRH